jgi:glycosyltransferase involved in cell wall biosynthesis
MLVLNDAVGDARVYKEAKTLAKAGHRVLVLAVRDTNLPARVEIDGFTLVRVALRSRSWGMGSIARLIKYAEYSGHTLLTALKADPDVVHAHDANTLPLAWLIARLSRARLVYDAHEFEPGRNWIGSNLPPLVRSLWILQEQLFIRRADLVITVGHSIAGELARIYAIPRPTVVLNTPEPRTPGPSRSLREWLHIPAANPIILYQGAVTSGRGLRTLVTGAMQIPEAMVVILGSGPYLSALRDWIEQHGWSNRVCLPGQVELADLLEFTASADIGVSLIENICQSYYYSLPNKLFEYLQAGIPVVASNFPEMKRIVTQYGVGVTVNPASPEDLTNALRLLIEQPALYGQMRVNTAEAAQAFNWSHEADKLLTAYAWLDEERAR